MIGKLLQIKFNSPCNCFVLLTGQVFRIVRPPPFFIVYLSCGKCFLQAFWQGNDLPLTLAPPPLPGVQLLGTLLCTRRPEAKTWAHTCGVVRRCPRNLPTHLKLQERVRSPYGSEIFLYISIESLYNMRFCLKKKPTTFKLSIVL